MEQNQVTSGPNENEFSQKQPLFRSNNTNLGPTLNRDAAPLMLHVAHQVTLGLIEVPYGLKEVTHGPNHVILEPC